MQRSLMMTIGLMTCCVQSVSAQEIPGFPSPTDEHKWLTKFVGEWDVKSKGTMGEGQPTMETKGTIKSELLGDFWVMNVMDGNVAGMAFKGVQTIGYDPAKKKYIGTWVDSTNSFMWHYEGSVDESGKKLVLNATGPDMMNPGKMRKYRDAYEFTGKDTVLTTSSLQKDDGTWLTFMSGTGTRVEKNADGRKK